MTRQTPVPYIRISYVTDMDPDTQLPSDYIDIDVTDENGDSCGMIVLNDLQDIFILEKAIDAFIVKHNIIPEDPNKEDDKGKE